MKGCLGLLIGCALLGAGLAYALYTYAESGVDLAIGGGATLGVISLVVSGFYWNVGQALRDRARIGRSLRGAPPRDGRVLAAVGRMEALEETVRGPITGEECVAYDYTIFHIDSDGDRVTDYSGSALVPCVIRGPAGDVRLLGYPDWQQVPEDRPKDAASHGRARAYVASTPFERISPLNFAQAFRAIKGLVTDDDGRLRRDWAPGSGTPDIETLRLAEKRLPVGTDVCVMGLYSAAKGGLIPDAMGKGLPRVVVGSADEVRTALGRRALFQLLPALLITGIVMGGFAVVPALRSSGANGRRGAV